MPKIEVSFKHKAELPDDLTPTDLIALLEATIGRMSTQTLRQWRDQGLYAQTVAKILNEGQP